MTPKEIAVLTRQCHRMKAQGLNRQRIAVELKIPRDTVSFLLSGWGRGRPKVSAAVQRKIAALASKGLTRRAIAQKLGVSVPTAHKYMPVREVEA